MPDKGPYSHGYGLPEVIYGCESWTVKKAERWELMVSNCGVREDSWELLGQQGDQTSQPWIFTGRTHAETEAPIPRSSDANTWFIGKDPDAGKDWRCQRMRWLDSVINAIDMNLVKFQEMVRHRDAWLAACCPWGCQELDTTGQLNNMPRWRFKTSNTTTEAQDK